MILNYWLDQRIILANDETCSVYSAFYQHFPDKKAVFFKPLSQSYDYFPSERTPQPPAKFMRNTGEFETVEWMPGSETYQQPIREAFEEDTAEYFSAVTEGDAENISHCFDSLSEKPSMFADSIQALYARETTPGRDDQGFVTLWSVSPVGFSDDGRLAIMYAENSCGGLCGWGGFVLFKQVSNKWTVAGDSWRWVS